MKKIGLLILKNKYILWEDNGEYFLESVKGNRNQSISEKVNLDDINMTYELTKGTTISTKKLEHIVRENKDKFSFPAEIYETYKIYYCCQELLICLVCLKKAIYRKEGREYLYTIL